jgi:serine/threonine protein kinase
VTLCINPFCSQPEGNLKNSLFCQHCNSELLINGIYRVTKRLGEGGFGTTYEVSDGNTTKVLKVLKESQPKAIELFEREFQVLNQLNHSGFPKVEQDDFFQVPLQNPQSSVHCLVMEKIEGIDLEQWMEKRGRKPVPEKLALRWLKHLVEILGEVHQQKYFHRDIKPSNVMLRSSNGQLVLIDFGGVKEFSITSVWQQGQTQQHGTVVLSRGYTPLEQKAAKTVLQSDFFALGRTFVYLLTGHEPTFFTEDYEGRLVWRDRAPQASEAFLNLIDDLMAPNFRDRPKNTQDILHRIRILEQTSYTLKPQPLTPKLQANPFSKLLQFFFKKSHPVIGTIATSILIVLFSLNPEFVLSTILVVSLVVALIILFRLVYKFWQFILRNF